MQEAINSPIGRLDETADPVGEVVQNMQTIEYLLCILMKGVKKERTEK